MATRVRRTRAAIRKYADHLIRLVAEHAPASVRQIFYVATTLDLEEKSERGYKRIVEQLSNLRLSGEIPWKDIADRSRWQRKPLTFSGPRAAMEHTRRTYRRGVWHDLEERVFMVLEKDALVGVVGGRYGGLRRATARDEGGSRRCRSSAVSQRTSSRTTKPASTATSMHSAIGTRRGFRPTRRSTGGSRIGARRARTRLAVWGSPRDRSRVGPYLRGQRSDPRTRSTGTEARA